MESKYQETYSTVRRPATSAKRKSEESLERPSKRSRTSKSPSNCCRNDHAQPSRITSLGYSTNSSPLESTGEILRRSTIISEPLLSKKRKSTNDVTEERARKRIRKTSVPDEDQDAGTSKTIPSSTKDAFYSAGRAVFEARYSQGELLGEGGFGAVYAGFRRADNLPIAIKRMDQSKVDRTVVIRDAKVRTIPLEVVLHQKVQSTDGSGPSVTLLDWFDLGQEVILVLERPTPCVNLFDYLCDGEFPMPENQAKIIVKQLVDALMEIESQGVFHRDIKLENILVETSSGVPRVRIIDFGCGTYLSEGFYTAGRGTRFYLPPELFKDECYKAKQATVWQLGVLLYALLHGELPFEDIDKLVFENPPLDENISICCQRFLQGCLSKNPESRATLKRLKGHPWLE